MSLSYEAHPGSGRALFGAAELGDRRRTERLVYTFDRMCTHPGGTLPDKLAAPQEDCKVCPELCNLRLDLGYHTT